LGLKGKGSSPTARPTVQPWGLRLRVWGVGRVHVQCVQGSTQCTRLVLGSRDQGSGFYHAVQGLGFRVTGYGYGFLVEG